MHQYPHPPFKNGGKVTTGYSKTHKAKDITPRLDDSGKVFAIEDGTVSDVQSGKKAGDENSNMVIVRDAAGVYTVYGHVDPAVKSGTSVKQGDQLGKVDLSGDSSGLHVHLVRIPPQKTKTEDTPGSVDDILARQDEGEDFAIDLNAW
jgi:murein DD-endopeptidase MepM/ murein hydrolase activator NlpD